MFDYRDFELEVGALNGATYPLAVRSPGGETRQALTLPFTPAELAGWRRRLEVAIVAGAAATRGVRLLSTSPADEALSAQAFGANLFAAVFAGDVLSLYDASHALARQAGAGLRLRLRILAPELAALPWELLYDPRSGEYLCLSAQTPLVRAVETMQPLQKLVVEPPLRILGMAVAPVDLPPLNVTREQQHLSDLHGMAGLELAWTDGGDWRALQDSLQQGPWHIFHFIGHGTFDVDTAEGALAFADGQGRADLRSTQEITRLLADHPSLRLAVLNACEGAQTGTQALYTSIAETLVRRGLPAVLAMQYVIGDAAAVELARSFYGALANGLPVDAASGETRKAMSLAAPGSWEWATPVLFLRSADGHLWNTQRATRNEENTVTPERQTPWWEQVSNAIGQVDASDAEGDVIIATVGAGARNVVIGKNITQTVTEVLGPPTPDDKTLIEQQLVQVNAVLAGMQGRLDAGTAQMAQFQMQLLQGELTKTAKDETPSASTIIMIGDWLLNNLPALGETLGSLFALPAVGRVIGKAGETAVQWVQQRFRE